MIALYGHIFITAAKQSRRINDTTSLQVSDICLPWQK
jgi:hypothetical protein